MKANKTKLFTILLAVSLCLLFYPLNSNATVTVPTTTYLSMPSYSTAFNFASEQTFNNLWHESSSNTTYPDFWFMTLTTGETYGLAGNCNFTVNTFFSGKNLTIAQASSGTVYVYCGSLGNPTYLYSSHASGSYNAATKIYTLTYTATDTVTVTWNPVVTTYPIITTANSGGSISPSGTVYVAQGGSQTFFISPNLGYHTTSINVDGSPIALTNSYTFNNVLTSHTLTANFAANTSIITASADANCTITPTGEVSVNYGNSQTFSYSANAGYQVTSVIVDGSPVSVQTPTGTYVFSNVITNHTISVSASAEPTPTPTPTPTITPQPSTNPNPFNHPTQVLNLYMRSDTYNFSTASGYGLDSDYTNSYVNIPTSTTATNATITYGFRVYLAVSATEYREVTSGQQIGLIPLSGNFTGQLSSSWNCPDTSVVLGSEALRIDLYVKIDNGSWTLLSTFLSHFLMTKELYPSTWSFTLNLAMTQLNGNTTALLSFGDTAHRSTINGVTIVTPNYTDIQTWQWSQGDIIGLILGSYLNVMGGGFFVLIYLGIFGSLWFRHRSVGPVVFIVVLLGGTGSLSCWVLLPSYAAAIFSVFILLGIAALIFKVIR